MNSSLPGFSDLPCGYTPLDEFNWGSGQSSAADINCHTPEWNKVFICLIAAFDAVALWIGMDLLVQLFLRFRKRTTLYFWSILICACGTIVFAVSIFMTELVGFSNASLALNIIGMVAMETAFPLMMYSRLYLLLPSKWVLLTTLYGTIAVITVVHIPVIVAATYDGPAESAFIAAIRPCELITSMLDILLASLFIYQFLQFTKDSRGEAKTKSTFALFVAAFIVVFCVEVALSVVLFVEGWKARQMCLALAYAIMIKVEFVVLNSLVHFSQHTQNCMNGQMAQALDSENSASPISRTTQPTSWSDVENLNAVSDVQARICNVSRLPIVPANSYSEVYLQGKI